MSEVNYSRRRNLWVKWSLVIRKDASENDTIVQRYFQEG